MPLRQTIHPTTRCRAQPIAVFALWTLGALLMCLMNVSSSEDDIEPLARCRLQTIPTPPEPAMADGLVIRPAQRPDSIINANYRRDRSGDWDVPYGVTADDAGVCLLLITPDGPLFMHLTILVDGMSFRKTREGWIEQALLSEAQAEVSEEPEVATAQTDEASEGSINEESSSTAVEIFQPTAVLARLQKYAAQPALKVDRDEARWLLAQWSPGPTLLELRSKFAIERSRIAPLWAALDADANGELSPDEMNDPVSRIRSLDHDEDDWVNTAELTESPLIASWTASPLVIVLHETTDWRRLTRQLRESYGDHDQVVRPLMRRLLTDLGLESLSQLTAENLSQLIQAEPALEVTTDLATAASHETGLKITSMTHVLTTQPLAVVEERVSLTLPHCVVELSAGQRVNDQDWNGQVAIGAVIDGSPLMRQVDADNDHRLSLREIEAIAPLLTSLDRDGDGTVRLNEVPVPLRFTVTLGAHAHTLLGQAAASATASGSTNTTHAPPWFASMDLNRDGDLTAAEFLGTQEQFNQLDLDHDQRISTSEAAKLRE